MSEKNPILERILKRVGITGKEQCAPGHVILQKIHNSADKFKKSDKSGLFEDKKSLEFKGLVLVVGKEVDWIKKGDVIHHGAHSGVAFDFKGETFLAMNVLQINLAEPAETLLPKEVKQLEEKATVD